MAKLTANVSSLGVPFVDADRMLTPQGRYFLMALMNRSGGIPGRDAIGTEAMAGWGVMADDACAPEPPVLAWPPDDPPSPPETPAWVDFPDDQPPIPEVGFLSLLAMADGDGSELIDAAISPAMRPVVSAPTLAAALVALSTPVAAGFTPAGFTVSDAGTHNGIVGQATNNAAPSTTAFPSGVTGYGIVAAAGNQAYGVLGRADLTTAGVAANVFQSWNTAGTPSGTLPPPLAIGTADYSSIALLAEAQGTAASALGLGIVQGSQSFQTGIYIGGGAALRHGLIIDANATNGPGIFGAVIRTPSATALRLQTTGSPGGNAVLDIANAAGTTRAAIYQDGAFINDGFSLMQNGTLAFRTPTVAGSASTGGGSALPAAPQGYLTVNIGGSNFKLPYYNP